MSSPNTPTSASEQGRKPVLANHLALPTLASVSDLDRTRVSELLFSPASPITAPLHRSRIEELLSSPTSPTSNPFNDLVENPSHPSYDFYIARQLPQSTLPDSFDELHSERSYLISCLQTENHKTTGLLEMITPLEEQLTHPDKYFTQRRKTKKRLGWLRHRLDATSRQEKRILARLEQLSFEIQTRERWTQIEFERRQREVEQLQGYVNYQPAFYGMQQISSDPKSTNFIPQEYLRPWLSDQWQQWNPNTPQGLAGFYWPPPSAQSSFLETPEPTEDGPRSEEISPTDTSAAGTPGSLRPHLSHRSSSLNDATEALDILSTTSVLTAVPRVKRLSLPALQLPGYLSIWARTAREKIVVASK